MEKVTAVSTCLGFLKGRDCIYLDQGKYPWGFIKNR